MDLQAGHIGSRAVDPNPPRPATLDAEACYSNTTATSLTFRVPSDGVNDTLIIWAMSNTRPDSSFVDAGLIQHTWHGGEVISFSKEMSETPDKTMIGYGTSKATDYKTGGPSLALIAHVTCGVLVTMLVLPGGVVVPRITRGITTTQSWFYFHMLNQGFFALALVSVNFGLGLTFGGEIDSAHRKTGTALFALVILQIVLGFFAHFYKPGHTVRNFTFETKRGRGPSNFLHVLMGIITVAVGWSACWSGAFLSDHSYLSSSFLSLFSFLSFFSSSFSAPCNLLPLRILHCPSPPYLSSRPLTNTNRLYRRVGPPWARSPQIRLPRRMGSHRYDLDRPLHPRPHLLPPPPVEDRISAACHRPGRTEEVLPI